MLRDENIQCCLIPVLETPPVVVVCIPLYPARLRVSVHCTVPVFCRKEEDPDGFLETQGRLEKHELSPDSGTDAGSRWEIISAYINVLENCVSPVENESLLPFSKDVIRRAIYEELTVNPDSEFRGHLEIAFARLESFLPYDEFKVIREFKVVSSVALRMAGTGDPADILASARILKEAKGERAVKIQEKVSKRMRKRLAQIQGVGGAALLPT